MLSVRFAIDRDQFNAYLRSQERIALAIEKLSAADQAEIDELVALQRASKEKLLTLLESVD